MALLWFDGLNDSDASAKYDGNPSLSSVSNPRTGASGSTSTGKIVGSNSFSETLTFGSTTCIAGFGFRYESASATQQEVFSLMEGTTVHLKLTIEGTPTGIFKLYNGSGTLLATGATAIATGTGVGNWYFVELKAKVDSSTGLYELRINDAAEFSGSSANTRNGGTGIINKTRWGKTVSAGTFSFDDIYVLDDTGVEMNDFLGTATRVDTLFVTGAGDSAAWTPSAGANYACVDDVSSHNSDTDYVSAASTGLKDSYNVTDLSVTPAAIKAAYSFAYVRRDDAGVAKVKVKLRSSSVVSTESEQALTTAYAFYKSTMSTTDPNGSAAWSKAAVDALQVEIERTT